jgi:hypothetical protein
MYVRVVRFTDVDPERIEDLKARIAEAGGPPEGVVSTGVEFLHDADQRRLSSCSALPRKTTCGPARRRWRPWTRR